MKKYLFAIFVMLISSDFNAQVCDTSPRKNDIMIDPVLLIAVPLINFSYERILSEDSGLGVNVMYGIGKDVEGNSQISPYYRWYFGKKYASGFFVDAFIPITTIKDEVYHTKGYYTTEKTTTPGIGVGFGGKWIAKENILFEASVGFARRFGNNENMSSEMTGRTMLGIGYRF